MSHYLQHTIYITAKHHKITTLTDLFGRNTMWTKAQTWVTRFYIFCKFQQFSFVVPIIFRQLKCVDSDLQNWWTVEVSNLAATWSRPNLTQSQQVEEMVLKGVNTKFRNSKHQDSWILRLYCTTSVETSVPFSCWHHLTKMVVWKQFLADKKH